MSLPVAVGRRAILLAKQAVVRREAYALNLPSRVVSGPAKGAQDQTPLVFSSSERVVIETVKPAEDGNGIVIRLYEAHNTRGDVTLSLHPLVSAVERCGLLEDVADPLTMAGNTVTLPVSIYETVTLRLRLSLSIRQ